MTKLNPKALGLRAPVVGLVALLLAPGCVQEHGGDDRFDDDVPTLDDLDPSDHPDPSEDPGEDDPVEDPNGPKDPGEEEDPGDDPVDDPGEEEDPGEDPVDEEPEEPTMKESTRHNLVWKRYRAVERDLMRGLALEKEQLCNELGQYACVDEVHLAPLGGNEPFELGQYEPVASPTATTAVALDRVVLSACVARVEEDRLNNPEVFLELDLDQASVSVADDGPALDATITTLYRRLLSRDPVEEELDAALALADEGPSAATFAKMACYAVGTTVENFFY